MWIPSEMVRFESEVGTVRSALSREEVVSTDNLIANLITAISSNLDTPTALKEVLNWASSTLASENADQQGAGELSRTLDALLGLAL